MAYFIPSSIQKRLLRYALSRLEFFDTDALDLEKLEIGWGRKSTVELKDVALRKAKLSSLLQLPSRMSIEHATVALLRVTVPADLLTASITVEIQGVHARARLLEEEICDVTPGATPTDTRRPRQQDRIRRGGSRTPHLPREHIPRKYGFMSDDAELDVLPTTHDLAASFLAEEPKEQKAQLEAAIKSRSTDLRQSIASNDNGDDGLAYGEDETAYGTGVGISLPAFLAGFLKGIIDRLQVIVNGLSIKLDVSIDSSSEDIPRLSESGNVSEATFGLYIETVKIYQGAVPPVEETDRSSQPNRTANSINEREFHVGERCLSITGISGSLVSDAATFAQLSQIFDSASNDGNVVEKSTNDAKYGPTGYAGSTKIASSPGEENPKGRLAFLSPSRQQESEQQEGLHDSIEAQLLDAQDFPDSFPRSSRVKYAAGESLADSMGEHALRSSRSPSPEQMYASHMESSENTSTYMHAALMRFREERFSSSDYKRQQLHAPHQEGMASQALVSPVVSKSPSVELSETQFQETSHQEKKSLSTLRSPRVADDFVEAMLESEGNVSRVSSEDELTESRVFSHDEAESIYMSALYDARAEASGEFRSPGQWGAPINSDDQSTGYFPSNTDPSEPGPIQTSFQELQREQMSPQELNKAPQSLDNSNKYSNYDVSRKRGTEEAEKPSMDPTPSSPSDKLLIRPLFHVTECRIWLPESDQEELSPEPSAEQDPTPKADVLTRSDYHIIPGAYSVYAESSLRESRSIAPKEVSFQPQNLSERRNSPVELSLGSGKARVDVFTSKLLVHLLRKVQSTFNPTDRPTPQEIDQNGESVQKNMSRTGLKINLDFLEVLFVEAVADRMFGPHSVPSAYSTFFESSSEKILFKLSIRDLSLDSPDLKSMIPIRFEVGQLRFGFADEDIFSFSRETRLRTSLRDVREVRDKDLSVEVNKINGNREIHIATQPVKIIINLQKIDNTLGSIGGLSSLLELGSSIASDSTIVSPTPKPQPRSRTVRFDSSTKPSPELAHDLQAKVNLKVSGAYISIRGTHSKIALQSSAIKVIARSTLIGLQIDDLRLNGPHVGYAADQAPFMVRFRDTRVKYLSAPEEHDLTRLISLLTPSKDKFEDDDDFLVDTLIRQRKKGSVLRFTMSKLHVDCEDLQSIDSLTDLSNEMSKMSSVTKFLPKESRPGLLALGIIDNISLRAQTSMKIGQVCIELGSTEIAHVTAPSLVALAVGKIDIEGENKDKVVTAVLPENCNGQQPMLMTRMIEDELEPSIKIKLWNTSVEYSVPLLLSILDRDEGTITANNVAVDLAASIAHLAERPMIRKSHTQSSYDSENSKSDSKPLKIDLALRECALGLTPRTMHSKALFVMTDARLLTGLPSVHGLKLNIELRKARLLLTNDFPKLASENEARSDRHELLHVNALSQIDNLCQQGYVCVTSISAASVSLNVVNGAEDEPPSVDVEFKDELFVLETCADSTQTLIETLNDLLPPTPPSKGQKYRTEVAPVEDMMASFTGDAFAVEPRDRGTLETEDADYYDSNFSDAFDALGDISNTDVDALSDVDDDFENDVTTVADERDGFTSQIVTVPLTKSKNTEYVSGGFIPGRLPTQVQGTANKWDSANNRYMPVKKSELSSNPLKVRIRDTHIIWNLYDGYDWEQTRDTISKAVQDVEIRAAERRQVKRNTIEEDDEEESVIGDFLFNSIYIGVPLNHDPKDLSRQINRNIDDLVSETASHAPSHTSTATSRPTSSHRTKPHGRKLKLNRSRRHKIAFELTGVFVDFFVFAPGGETQSSTDIRIEDFEIFDHVPTSTWKKFATYMHDAGPREDNKPMLHLEICDVRPVPELTAAELVIRVTVLPLRLHVDQDALDFITRFFEFHDDSKVDGSPPADQPYLQRVEVRPVPVKLDYKPKKIDYAGLRSGRTTEFMNFFILDGAEFVLKHVVVYGTSGFLKLHKSLEDVWMPDVKKNQLPSVLSGLNGVRTFVNVGTGVRDLIAIPIREYQKDGRIVRSISKGALAFARTTGSELTRFGAKMAIGAQTALQGAEGLFTQAGQPNDAGWEEMDLDPEERRAISHYANQPTGILQGLKGAARSLERDLLATRDIIIAISGEVRESSTAEGAALAVARHAPTLILRPMIGATKAISQTLMGATNTVDPQNKRRMDDKYKRY